MANFVFHTPINNAGTFLSVAHVTGDGHLVVSNPDVFGTPTALAPIRITVSDGTDLFIVSVDDIDGNTLNIDAFLEGTTDEDMPIGSDVQVRMTAGDLIDVHNVVNSASMVVGNVVGNSPVDNSILFANASGNLASSADLTWDGAKIHLKDSTGEAVSIAEFGRDDDGSFQSLFEFRTRNDLAPGTGHDAIGKGMLVIRDHVVGPGRIMGIGGWDYGFGLYQFGGPGDTFEVVVPDGGLSTRCSDPAQTRVLFELRRVPDGSGLELGTSTEALPGDGNDHIGLPHSGMYGAGSYIYNRDNTGNGLMLHNFDGTGMRFGENGLIYFGGKMIEPGHPVAPLARADWAAIPAYPLDIQCTAGSNAFNTDISLGYFGSFNVNIIDWKIRRKTGANGDLLIGYWGSGSEDATKAFYLNSDGSLSAGIGTDNAYKFLLKGILASSVVLGVRGTASQSGNLQEWQSNAGTVLASVSSGGVITGIGSGLTSLNASNLSSGTVPTARLGSGTASSSTYLRGDQSWVNPLTTGNAVASGTNNGVLFVNGSGNLTSGSVLVFDGSSLGVGTSPSAKLHVQVSNAATIPAIVQGASSQSAHLQEWRNDGGAIMSYVAADGNAIRLGPNFGNGYLSLGGSSTISTSVAIQIDNSHSSSSSVYGIGGEVRNASTGNVYGLSFGTNTAHTGTMVEAVSCDATWRNTSSGTVTSGYGIRVNTPGNSGGGTVDTFYGAYIKDITAATTNYAVYTNAGLNRFGDQVAVVGSADRIQHIVRGNGTQTAALAQWQNSGGTAVAAISNAGVFTCGDITATGVVTATGSGSGLAVNRRSDSGTAWIVYSDTGSLQFYAGGDRMVVDPNGYITLGVGQANAKVLFGGSTSSFPSLIRGSASLKCRLADDSGDADFSCANLTATGGVTPGGDTSLPSPSSTHRGKLYRLVGSTGVADELYICMKLADDSYDWVQLI